MGTGPSSPGSMRLHVPVCEGLDKHCICSLFLALLSSPLHAKGSAIAFPATLSTLMGLVCSTGLLPLEGGGQGNNIPEPRRTD